MHRKKANNKMNINLYQERYSQETFFLSRHCEEVLNYFWKSKKQLDKDLTSQKRRILHLKTQNEI